MALAVISTHPIQYQAPVYRAVQTQFDIPTTVIYGSDFSVVGYRDREFGTTFAWDTDLLSGYTVKFLSRVADGGSPSAEMVSARGVLNLLQSLNPDVILLLGYRLRFDLRAFWAARQLRVPLLFRAEAADLNRQRSTLKQFIRDSFLRWYYQQFTHILYIGQNALNHYRRLGVPDKRLIFSPYCVDTSIFRSTHEDRNVLRNKTRQAFGARPDQYVLLMSGKLAPRKAPDHLVQAVKQLPNELRNRLKIVFLGDGAMKSLLSQMCAVEPFVDVFFAGFQNQSNLSPFYHAADLLIMPSTENETWGLVVNEALQHGLPCVVSDRVGCASDLVKPSITGEIFATGSVESLAEAIQRGLKLIEQPDTQASCRETIRKYTVEYAAQGIAQAYRAVMNVT